MTRDCLPCLAIGLVAVLVFMSIPAWAFERRI
jgi:hypothetical protein